MKDLCLTSWAPVHLWHGSCYKKKNLQHKGLCLAPRVAEHVWRDSFKRYIFGRKRGKKTCKANAFVWLFELQYGFRSASCHEGWQLYICFFFQWIGHVDINESRHSSRRAGCHEGWHLWIFFFGDGWVMSHINQSRNGFRSSRWREGWQLYVCFFFWWESHITNINERVMWHFQVLNIMRADNSTSVFFFSMDESCPI